MKLRVTVIAAAAVLLVLGRETDEAVGLDKRTPVTYYKFLDDGASRLEGLGSESAHAVASSDTGSPSQLAEMQLSLAQPGREAQQAGIARPSLDSRESDVTLFHPGQTAAPTLSLARVQATRPMAQHAVPIEQEHSLTSVAAKAQVGSATSAFKPFHSRDSAPNAPFPVTGFDVPRQSSSLARRPHIARTPAARETGGPSHLPPPRDAPSSSREPKRTYTAEQKERRNRRERLNYRKLKEDAANGNIQAQEKLSTYRGDRRNRRPKLPEEKEDRNAKERLAYQKLKEDAAGPDGEVARMKLEKKRKYSRDTAALRRLRKVDQRSTLVDEGYD